jgi:hypothetical protein
VRFGLSPTATDISELKSFPAERVFNVVGTNPADYLVLKGLSSWAVGDASDGLVRIDNATTFGIHTATNERVESPRAFVHRSHSGQYGVVNSEEGYQNLTRFLFGSVRVDGILDVNDVTLPAEVETEYRRNKNSVRASYRFEIVATIRGSQWQLHRRTVRENSAIQRTYDELFPKGVDGERAPGKQGSPHLFSIFLDPTKSLSSLTKSIAFAFDLAVLVPDYQIDGVLWLNKHFEGGYLYRELILVEATPDSQSPAGWKLAYGFQSQTPNIAATPSFAALTPTGTLTFSIPVQSPQGVRPGIRAGLRMEMRTWS